MLKPGRQMGIQDSPPPALMPSASKIMLKISWRSLGCKECFFGRMTLTRRPPATTRPYRRVAERNLRSVLLIVCLCDLRSLRHSRAERRVEGDPLVKVSARDESKTSVPCSGRRRSVDGLTEKRCSNVGRVKVDKICMYRASS